MQSHIRTFFTISRPRFYSYLFGTFLVGVAAGSTSPTDLLSYKNILFLFFFTFPANLFLYGVNDIYDGETDAKNPKKLSHEHLLQTQQKSPLKKALWVVVILSCGLLLFVQPTVTQAVLFMLFLFLSWAYSAPPLRFKARRFADAYSNVLYALPGFLAYCLNSNQLPTLPVLLLGLSWTAGMHAFSAVPDIRVDAAAGIQTTAVYLGRKKTLLFILTNWLVFTMLAIEILGWVGIFGFCYPALAAYILWKNKPALSIYWYFPYMNAVLGFCAFWYLYLTRFGIATLWQYLPSL